MRSVNQFRSHSYSIASARSVEHASVVFQRHKMTEKVNPKVSKDLGFPETDFTLVVEDQKIHVNKAVISQHSPVFNAMFNSQFKERTAKEITLEDKKAEDVVEFLRCFYPNMKHPVTAETVLQVLPLAHEYQSPLVADCENFMISMCKPDKGLTVSTLLDYILAGEKYNWELPILQEENKDISLKFSMIELKTQYAISKKRVQHLEMHRRNPNIGEKNYTIALS